MSGARRVQRYTFREVENVAHILSKCYGDHAHSNKSNPLDELLFIICSTQTNEERYVASYAALRRRYRRFDSLLNASSQQIARTIAQGGLANQKARLIKGIFHDLVKYFGRPTLAPLRRMDDAACEEFLTALPGVGKKTSRCVMMYSLGRHVFPVDSNCWRICRRLGWIRPTRPDQSCSPRDMDHVQAGIPPEWRFSLHVNMVSLGRDICRARAPVCSGCPICRACKRIGLGRQT